MRVGIVGAGISGLAAARDLARRGRQVVVWERSSRIGGRIETVEIDGYVFDTGTPTITPRGMAIEKVMLEDLDRAGLVEVEKPIYTHEALRVLPGQGRPIPRYTYRSGNECLPRMLAEGLDVRVGCQVEEIARRGRSFVIDDEAYDALIITAPIPQTSALLWSLRESRPVANARYRPCLSVMLGFERPDPKVSYHAILDPEQRHPLTWLCLESVKSPGRAPNGCCAMVAQMSASYSQMRYRTDDREIIEDVLIYVRWLYGAEFENPAVAKVRRWKYSQPETVAQFDTVNHGHDRLLLAGDGLVGGRVETAFESGIKAARLIGNL
ncbi:MAG TPA: FAD-dependent oxidoreductase [Fimbriimonadaceae bacterium]|nr:FAD-dependent oxidoreductase [Fimbriimonadaceae bacterium]